MSIIVKQHDVGVLFTDTLTDGAGAPVPLTDATVLFMLRTAGGAVISRTATVVSAAEGTVSYTTVSGDLDTEGTYQQEWQATYVSGKRLTFPSTGYNKVTVLPDLG